ncbi:hypothetical protein ACZ90_13315 [Streptomyces albus subsp. albus]|nr:hypothetical protein ACZ90_13315 [Streptomyces albus subsp. albus]
MNHTPAARGGEAPAPPPPRPPYQPRGVQVVTARQLRDLGISPAAAAGQRAGGRYRELLPGIRLLHPGPATAEERLHAALLYTASRAAVPGPAMITGLAALALHHFSATPPLATLERIEVLVPRSRRLRSTGYLQVVRGPCLPAPEDIAGIPTAPVARALADAVAGIPDTPAVLRLLTEAVRGAHCETADILRELGRCGLLDRPQVADAMDAVLAQGRAMAEGRLYAMVRGHRLPEPLWNVALRLPGGTPLAEVDAYWPDQAVALALDTSRDRTAATGRPDDSAAHRRKELERLGICLLRVTPDRLRTAPADQAAVVRTALIAATEREPPGYVVVRPR